VRLLNLIHDCLADRSCTLYLFLVRNTYRVRLLNLIIDGFANSSSTLTLFPMGNINCNRSRLGYHLWAHDCSFNSLPRSTTLAAAIPTT
ncbi:MAG: hypothetical protein P8K08_26505, partial [Fuerstiella sp.]|nr:hypothetical protein [Fuerstiella sp.]